MSKTSLPKHFYENHVNIRKDKLCPIVVTFVKNHFDYFCNWHENIEVILVIDGNGAINYGREELPLSKGDISVVNSNAPHRIHSKTGIDYLYIIIDESFCTENGFSTTDRRFTHLFRSESTEKLILDLAETYDKYRKPSDPSRLGAAMVRTAMLELLIDLCKNHSEWGDLREVDENPSDKYVKKVITYMNEHYTEPVTLESLAEICKISKNHLSREFKRHTGETVLTYLNTLRCKNAEVCMAEGLSVTDTALECGFESLSYFSRTYKKIMGISPREAKKQNRSNI